jgi:glutamyl-tRNA reductase
MLPTRLHCLGLSYQRAPVELRERLGGTTGKLLDAGRPRPALVQELALLSTCHRVELYVAVSGDSPDGAAWLVDWLAAATGIAGDEFSGYLDHYEGMAAAKHLSRVACGLESLALGEPQILGQVQGAQAAALATGGIGPTLGAVFQAAVRAGKRARTETPISTNPASVSSVAIALAQEIAGDLRRARILVIGLGEMGRLTLKTLRQRGVARIAVANRTRERAERLAAEAGYRAYGLDELPEALAAADVVFSSTAAADVVLPAALVSDVLATRRGRDLVLVDIAVPRDIEPAVGDLPGVHLFDIDDLRETLDSGLAARQQAVPAVEAIIAAELAELTAALQQQAVAPIIVELRRQAEAIRRHEVERSLRHLGEVDPAVRDQLQQLSLSLVNKLLHEPTLRLKAKATHDEAAAYASTVRDLFGLPE